jgi:glycosyltransferase involved in cell wall biosynthesis
MKNLTICIPTYKRPAFLQWTLARTRKGFPDTQVVVSDNDPASDAFYSPELKVIYQNNIGAFPNMRAALLEAKTEYAVFLADDDYLVPERVAEAIQFMDKNPDVVAYYAPCQLYNEVADKSEWDAFYVSIDRTFHRADELWDFLIRSHVWPEHAIYRTAHLHKILQPRGYAYWCFVDLANAVKCGPVAFGSKPYYRNITHHPVGSRVKLGDQQCLTDFDNYRAGLEVLAYDLFISTLGRHPELLATIQWGISVFIWTRLEVAHRLRKMQGSADTETFYKRMMMARPQGVEIKR